MSMSMSMSMHVQWMDGVAWLPRQRGCLVQAPSAFVPRPTCNSVPRASRDELAWGAAPALLQLKLARR